VNRESSAAIEARNVTVGYTAGAPVIRDVSLAAAKGELLAIVGPNGAGKTTLLRLLNGSLQPWSGSVELQSQRIGEMDRKTIARQVAFAGQDVTLPFPFTVTEVVLMGRSPHLGPMAFENEKDLSVATDAMARFDLLPFAHRFVQELSGGERKRVFLARALAQEPSVMLLDEPTAFLDLKHVAETFSILRELRHSRGLTVIVSLHDLNSAALHADEVLLLKQGTVLGYGTPEKVFTQETLERVYEAEVYVGRNPATGTVSILPGQK